MHSHYVIMLRVPSSRVPAVSSIIIVSSTTSTFQRRWNVCELSCTARFDEWAPTGWQYCFGPVVASRPRYSFVCFFHKTRLVQIPSRQPSSRHYHRQVLESTDCQISTEKRPTNRCVSNPFRQDLHTGIPSCQEPQQQLNDDMWECAV